MPQETISAELTQGQLVIGICVALAFAMFMFGLGMIVKKVDPPAAAVAQNDAVPPMVVTTNEAPPEEAVAETADNSETNEPLKAVEAPAITPESLDIQAPTPRVTPLPSRPSASQSADVEVTPLPGEKPVEAPVVTPTEPETPKEPEKPVAPLAQQAGTAPAKPPVKLDVPDDSSLESMTAVPTAPATKPVEKPADKPVEAAPVTPPAANGPMGKFGIQLASFQGDKRKADAEGYARQVREKLNRDARAIPSPDDQIHRVLIVGFTTRDEANKACNEMKSMAGFRDAFVKPL
ncbi:MAG: hypothetical protein GC168_14455 [Candidatus Hydrogenedens sp.]|nr:hypothetical protein [Candidatus Hydrogenedens sp.]